MGDAVQLRVGWWVPVESRVLRTRKKRVYRVLERMRWWVPER